MRPSSVRLLIALCCGLASVSPPLGAALPVDSYELRRNEAYKLTDGHSKEAEKALLALLKERPGDGGVLFALGRVAWHDASPLKPGSRRKQLNRKALDYFARARAAGFTDPLIDSAFSAINPDGSENKAPLSDRATVDRLMQEGERHFGRREFAQAFEKYAAAFKEEPTNYAAALYAGDAHFAAGKPEEAIGWFDQAGALDPDRETAHRYAGDALMKLGQPTAALERYLAAAVAEPYNAYPWRTLNNYCRATLIKAWTAPRTVPEAEVTEVGDKSELGLPENFTPFDLLYGYARIAWQKENRAQRFPAGTKYRLTLEEEGASLRTTLKAYREMKQAPNPPADLAAALEKTGMFLDHLVAIEDAGLLEAHILLVRGNADLAEDYPAYRTQHRPLLREYLTKFYLHLQ